MDAYVPEPDFHVVNAFDRVADQIGTPEELLTDTRLVREHLHQVLAYHHQLKGMYEHQLTLARSYFSRVQSLENELIRMRGVESTCTGELGSVCLSVNALCALLEGQGCGPDVDEAIEEVRAAISGKHAKAITSCLGDSYSRYTVVKVVRKMLRKMKSSPKLIAAAEKWLIDQLHRAGNAAHDYERRIAEGRE